jgi:hypothetical protein
MGQSDDQQRAETERHGSAPVRPAGPPPEHVRARNVAAVVLFVIALVVIAIALFRLLA